MRKCTSNAAEINVGQAKPTRTRPNCGIVDQRHRYDPTLSTASTIASRFERTIGFLMNLLLKWNPDLEDDTLPERGVDIVLGGIAAR